MWFLKFELELFLRGKKCFSLKIVEQIDSAGFWPIIDRWKTGVCVWLFGHVCMSVEVILGFLLTAAGCG